MANLKTQADCFALAKLAGFDDKNAEVAAAIAVTETLTYLSGKQYADFAKVGDVGLMDATWGASYGGWQIRSLKAQLGTNQFRDAQRLSEPNFNASSAFRIWKDAGGKFTPWSTFTSGAYLGAMQSAVYNPKPTVPPGSWLVQGGDSLSKIGVAQDPDVSWRLIAAVNNIPAPNYTIYPGQVILLPSFPYTVKATSTGAPETLAFIATTYSHVTASRIASYNGLALTAKLTVGQTLKIPRYTSWDGITLVR